MISRRKFLRATTAGLSAAVLEEFLAACGQSAAPPATLIPISMPSATPTASQPESTPAPTVTPAPVDQTFSTPGEVNASATPAAATETATPKAAPDLVVARGGEPGALVQRAIAALGGMEQFVSKGARVVIKPNICTSYRTYEYAATTNPEVVAALVRLCLEAGASQVQVFDYPFDGSLMEAYQNSGMSDAVKQAGGEMTPMAGYQYVDVDIPDALSLMKTKAYKDALEADVLINVPIAKHHSSTRLTLGMKNLMGIIQNRSAIHADLWHRIPDLARLFQPTLTVIDAVRILTAHGPTGGSLDDVKKLDTVIASRDIVAADAYATSLFGIEPGDIPYIPVAAQAGLGRMDLHTLRIEELAGG